MNYKIFAVAALMITVWMTEVKAAAVGDCPKCSFLTIGDPCGKNLSKLDSRYWGCRTVVAAAYFHCSALVCRTSPDLQAKFEKNKSSCNSNDLECRTSPDLEAKSEKNKKPCNSNATTGQCVNELNLDVVSAMANMKQRQPESLNSAHDYLQPFIEKAATGQNSKQEKPANKENKEAPYKNLVK